MTDVRLTATNPDDSSVVPVACNAKGELKLEDLPPFDGNVDGDLTVAGSASIEGSIKTEDYLWSIPNGANAGLYLEGTDTTNYRAVVIQKASGQFANDIELNFDGSAIFSGEVIVGSRGSQWLIVESGGLAHLIQPELLKDQPKNNYPQPKNNYPQLRNIPNELTLVEQALSEVMEKLRMTPPAGWPVWDGSDENS